MIELLCACVRTSDVMVPERASIVSASCQSGDALRLHILLLLLQIMVTGVYPSWRGVRGGVHVGQASSLSQGHTQTHNRPHSHHVFGLWEEARV